MDREDENHFQRFCATLKYGLLSSSCRLEARVLRDSVRLTLSPVRRLQRLSFEPKWQPRHHNTSSKSVPERLRDDARHDHVDATH